MTALWAERLLMTTLVERGSSDDFWGVSADDDCVGWVSAVDGGGVVTAAGIARMRGSGSLVGVGVSGEDRSLPISSWASSRAVW
jgi:hypothetical protein